jgi:hypothetical protein
MKKQALACERPAARAPATRDMESEVGWVLAGKPAKRQAV